MKQLSEPERATEAREARRSGEYLKTLLVPTFCKSKSFVDVELNVQRKHFDSSLDFDLESNLSHFELGYQEQVGIWPP